jgi:purine-binding chemotaxis protein CheW
MTLVPAPTETSNRYLLLRVGPTLCALGLETVVEIMRPLGTETLSGVPPFVRGLAVIRGASVPVLDLGLVLGQQAVEATRYVSLRVERRTVALAVDAVVGIGRLDDATLTALPPLLREASGEVIAKIGALDAGLLLVLAGARIAPPGLLERVDRHEARP